MRLTVPLAAFAVLAGCASLSESDCRQGAWRDIGLADGARGKRSSYIMEHAKSCSEFGITPNVQAWHRGREVGLQQYCTAANAHYVGTTGARLSPVCRGEDINALQAANLRGLQWHEIGREIDEARQEIREINTLLSELSTDSPERASLVLRRSFLRLEILNLQTQRTHYRYRH
ncbi:MAG: DUF2799 domain-containing protein [Boseongicola sp. SB0676_bin_33]|uniref:DUF2799 domain-containing protein n=1 Tax=Boseongicola sp. SB0664_bin_43 TaxID=2604844 RepID=A0A6B0XZC8_9RHOB|nr:DUF2799 domain-containing protein [Boseongicola sp. SB0664_bin_43]MYF90088.1 DUF2799 domain-containing protein [Boseongicola sp. SB0676_bin_33]MYK32216.1 DUF2799 domain-containing protein [Boseongicola sp. SB0670_bin_30]